MNRLSKSKSPMWRRSMMDRLNLQDIVRDLEEISESGDYYGYEGESLGEYYNEYRPLFDELSAGACDLLDAISRLEEYDGEDFAGWDDFTVALILALCGCGTLAAASEDNVQSSFSLDWIDSKGMFDLYQDRETGVQYIVYNHATRYGITPRYNADGSLYCGKESHNGY